MRGKKVQLKTDYGILVLQTIITAKAERILQQRFGPVKSIEFITSQHIQQIRTLLDADRPKIEQQSSYLHQIHPRTYFCQRLDSPFEVHTVSRIARIEKKWLRKKRLYWYGILCAPDEIKAAEAKLDSRGGISLNSNGPKPSKPSQAHQQEVSLPSATPSKRGNRICPQSLPFSLPSLMYMTPDTFEKYEAVADSVPDIHRQLTRMKDGVAANLMMWQQLAVAEPGGTVGGVDPRVEAKKTLTLWIEYAEYVGITEENRRRAQMAFDKKKVVHSIMDGALIIID